MSTAIRAITRLQDADDYAGAPADGQVLTYDGDLAKWSPAALVPGVTDHGALDGLADDDHAQYALADASRGAFLPLAGGTLTGVTLLPDGTVVAPALGFASQTGIGISRPSSGKLTLSAGAIAVFDVTSATISAWTLFRVRAGANAQLDGGELSIVEDVATNVPLTVQGAVSQAVDLQRWQNSAGTALVSVGSGGNLSLPRDNARLFVGGTNAAVQFGVGGRIICPNSDLIVQGSGSRINAEFLVSAGDGGRLKAVDVASGRTAGTRFEWNATGIGFFAVAPVAQPALLADPAADAAALATWAASINTLLKNYGLMATA